VARQPVFDRKLNTWAYELLFRHSASAQTAVVTDSEAATLQIIADGIAIALPSVDQRRKVMVNFPQSLLLKEVAFALPPQRCVIEILESVEPRPEILEACRRLKEHGYQLALDDFVGQRGYEPLLDLADVVKVDILHMTRARINRVVQRIHEYGCELLAEKVEDRDTFEYCKSLGFDYFQGFFFSKPVTMEGRKVSANQVSRLRLITELGQHEFDAARLSKILQTDASLSHRLFRYVHSVAFGVRSQVKSIKHALVLLGEVQTKEWLRVILLTDLSSSAGAEELLFVSAQRGRFLELLAQGMVKPPLPPEGMFLLGLFSLLDSLMGQPMPRLMETLPIDERIKHGLCDPTSGLRIWLDLLSAQEHARWDEVEFLMERLGVEPAEAERLYARAMEWAQEVLSARDAAA